MKNLVKVTLCLLSIVSFSCSSDDDTSASVVDNRSFTVYNQTDFFINSDGTVNLSVSGTFTDDSNDIKNRGFVHDTASKPEVKEGNTTEVAGSNTNATGYIKDLEKGRTYFVRGYFEMSDGSFFYGEEIEVSTDVDASMTRSIAIEIESDPFFISDNEITPEINLLSVAKELPVEIGLEYSVNSDFSNSSMQKINNYNGKHNQGVLVSTNYASEVISGLNASTTYYVRPYAKYADDTIANGGTSTASFVTSDAPLRGL